MESETLPAAFKTQKERARAWDEMRRFYQKRQFQPVWSDVAGPLPARPSELLQAIDGSASEGLDPGRYQRGRAAGADGAGGGGPSLKDPQAQRRVADLDVQLTFTYLTLAAHMATGRLQPDTLRIDWYTKPRNVDLDARLEKALDEEGGVAASLRALAPPREGTPACAKPSPAYREIVARGGWQPVPPGDKLKAGATGPRVAALRARLAASGDLAAAAPQDEGQQQPQPQPAAFDGAVEAAVKRFQQRHGLDATGEVDEDTIEALNVPGRHAGPAARGQPGALALAADRLRRALHRGQRPRVPHGPRRRGPHGRSTCGWSWARSRAGRRSSATRWPTWS